MISVYLSFFIGSSLSTDGRWLVLPTYSKYQYAGYNLLSLLYLNNSIYTRYS